MSTRMADAELSLQQSQDPQQLVPGAKPSTWSGAGRTGQDGELMAQQQVLEHEVLARAHPGQDCHELQPHEFQHASALPIYGAREVFRPTTTARDVRTLASVRAVYLQGRLVSAGG